MSFCVECGKDCEESLDGMCIDCWLDGKKLSVLPHHIDLKRCANCGEFGVGERWFRKDVEIAVQDIAADHVTYLKGAKPTGAETSLVCKDPYVYEVTVRSFVNVMGYEAVDEATTLVRIKNSVCKRCSRQLGNYYEAILQLRTGAKELSEDLKEEALAYVEDKVAAHAETNRSVFITKMEAVTGGVDVYLSSMSLARAVARELADMYCGEFKESPKLVGQTQDGQDMYRLTYLVRLPEYRVGDVVVCGGRHCKLMRVNGGGGRVMDLMTFAEHPVRRADMPGLRLYEAAEDLAEADVISRSGSEVQVLHPTNYSVVDLRVPEGYEAGDRIKVVAIDDTLYAVP